MRLRGAVISRYFPKRREQLEALFCEKVAGEAERKPEADGDEENEKSVGRNIAFAEGSRSL